MSKITPTIYKIDIEKVSTRAQQLELPDSGTALLTTGGELVRIEDAHQIVKLSQDSDIQNGITKAKSFELLDNGIQRIGQSATVAIYGVKNNTRDHEWQELFPETVGDLKVKRQNLAAFIFIENECYAISAGSGYTLFERFIDTSFPINVARRIMNPEVDATTEREIAGAIYGRIQQFRTSQLIASSQNLGTVWQGLSGKVNDTTQIDASFSDLFDTPAPKTGLTAGSSLTIKRSISINKLVNLIEWVIRKLDEDPTEEQLAAFRFLDSLQEVTMRKDKVLIGELELALAGNLFEALRSNDEINFDFCHRYMGIYLGAENYRFSLETLNDASRFDNNLPPTAHEVLTTVFESVSPQTPEELLTSLRSTDFIAEQDGDIVTRSLLINHLHGEITYLNKSYFLIDQKWYLAEDAFIERVNEDFEKLLNSDFVNSSGTTLEQYNHSNEEEYNKSYIGKTGWLVADRVFHENIEIADLIQFTDNTISIVHNKIGFDVKIRDVCSQILHSMNVLDRAKNSSDRTLLGDYYDKIIEKYYTSGGKIPPMEKSDFIDKILTTSSHNITFILGYVSNRSISTRSKSNIAKFETVKLCRSDKRMFDFELKIEHVEIT